MKYFSIFHQGCYAGTGAIVRLPQCQWSKPDGYGKISQCITTTKHSKAKTVCIFLGIYCTSHTIVSWPNPKQWVIVHTFDLMIMIIRQNMSLENLTKMISETHYKKRNWSSLRDEYNTKRIKIKRKCKPAITNWIGTFNFTRLSPDEQYVGCW